MKGVQEYLAFNRGKISRLAMARTDLKRTALSAAIQTNWIPRVLGSMMLRPGLGLVNIQPGPTRLLPFIFSSKDAALIEVHDGSTSFTVDDVRVSRPAVTATVVNGTFDATLTGWTMPDAGTVNAWQPGGYAGLAGNGTSIASLQQQVAVSQSGVEHALRIVIQRGPVKVRIGSTSGGAEYLADTELGTGAHSFAFKPSGDFWVKFFNQNERIALVDSCTVEAAGAVNLPTPWALADFPYLRFAQSGDIVFIACKGKQQRRILRRPNRSWSIDLYLADDGPFRLENVSTTTLAPSGLSGNIQIASSAVAGTGVFRPGHVGAIFSISSTSGQTVTSNFTSDNAFTGSIRVTGVDADRQFAVTVDGTFVATVTLQRSLDEGATWVDVESYVTSTSKTYDDTLDNQIVWYRLGIKTGNYTSGTATASLAFSSGSITGIARVTGYTSSVLVDAEVLKPFGGITASDVWAEGRWSDFRGWPSAVRFHDSRLWWSGKDRFNGSVTDQFYTHDANFIGDAGPISRSIGYGPVDTVNWMLSLDRLVAGTDGAEIACRSSSFNEPLTPTNFTPKNSSTQGSAEVDAEAIDDRGLFVQKNGRRLYELTFDGGNDRYQGEDLTALVPEIGDPGIISIVVQRRPDTRVHCLRKDGTVGVLVFDRTENVICWVDVVTGGLVTAQCVLPGTEEDFRYYVVNRNGTYCTEKWAFESECKGGAVNKLADSFVFAAGAGNTVAGLGHLEGREVIACGTAPNADGVLTNYDLGSFTVAGGSITLPGTYTNRCAGLVYSAPFKSTKLAYVTPGRSALTLKKKVDRLGIIACDMHPRGLMFGPSFDKLQPLPETDRYGAIDLNKVWDEFDTEAFEFPGEWDTDSRVCLFAQAPRACTLLAAVIEMDTNTRNPQQ